ncbi:MAG: hypothetical protein ACRC2J_18140 [Microcoleaceae cyanobacterium]
MAVLKKYINMHPNGATVNDPALSFSEVLYIGRQGVQYKEVSVAPVGRQCRYEQNGTFTFDSSIYDGTEPPGRFIPDKILVIYKQ